MKNYNHSKKYLFFRRVYVVFASIFDTWQGASVKTVETPDNFQFGENQWGWSRFLRKSR